MADEFGFTPDPDDEFGFKPEDGGTPAAVAEPEPVPSAGELERGRQGAAAQKQLTATVSQMQAQAQQAQEQDPRTWSSTRLQQHFRKNPPKTPQAQAQANALLQSRKDQEAALVEQLIGSTTTAGMRQANKEAQAQAKAEGQYRATLRDTAIESLKQSGLAGAGLAESIGSTIKWAGDALIESSKKHDTKIWDAKPIRTAAEQGQQITYKLGSFIHDQGLEVQDFWRQVKKTKPLQPDARFWKGSFMAHPSWQRVVALGAGAIPSFGAAAAVTLATRNPWAGAGLLGTVYGSSEYQAARDAGKDFNTATLVGASNVVFSTITERLPLGSVLKARGPITKAAVVGVQEGLEEVVQQLWTNAAAKLGYDNTRRYFENVAESFVAGMVSGGFVGGLTGSNTREMADLEAQLRAKGMTAQQVEILRTSVGQQIAASGESIQEALDQRREGTAPAEPSASPASSAEPPPTTARPAATPPAASPTSVAVTPAPATTATMDTTAPVTPPWVQRRMALTQEVAQAHPAWSSNDILAEVNRRDVLPAQVTLPSGKNYAVEPSADVLHPADRELETWAFRYITDDPEAAIQAYLKKAPNTVNADTAKELLARPLGVDVKPLLSHAAAIQEPSSLLAKLVFDRLLETRQGQGNNTVLVLGGGPGSGKTTTARNLLPVEDYAFTLDKVLASKASAQRDINTILAHGYNAHVAWVWREPGPALEGAIHRAEREGRSLPVEMFVNAHGGSLEAAQSVPASFAEHPRVWFIGLDNRGPQETTHTFSLDDLGDVVYDLPGVLEESHERVARAVKEGRLSPALGAAFSRRLAGGRERTSLRPGRGAADAGRAGQVGAVSPQPGAETADLRGQPAGVTRVFVSPNIEETLTRSEAIQRLSSSEQARFEAGIRDIDASFGLTPIRAGRAIGDWTDGAENSHVSTYRTTDYSAVRASAAQQGLLGYQKQVLAFREHADGQHVLYRLAVPGVSVETLADAADAIGLQDKTVQPTATGATLYVSDAAQSLSIANALAQLKGGYAHATVNITAGTSDWIGGTTRAEGRREFQRIVTGYLEARGVRGGHDAGAGHGDLGASATRGSPTHQELSAAGTDQGGTTAVAPDGKERKFVTTVKESPKTAPEVAAAASSTYSPITNQATLDEAKHLLETDREAVVRMVEGPETPTALSNAAAILLIDEAQQAGRFQDAIRLVERTAEKQTALGQAIQALSIYNRLTPEGILAYAQKQIAQATADVKQPERLTNFEKLSKALTTDAERAALAKKLGIPYLSEELAAALRQQATEIQAMPEGRQKQVATALLLKQISDQIPVSLGRKISMLQTMAQLLNPKTIVRNLLGNVGFWGMENLSETVATAIDVASALHTGRRTVALPNLAEQARGFSQGAREGAQEALLGINLREMGQRFDLPRNGVFHTGVLNSLEKTLSLALRAPDQAFYQAAFNQSLRQQMALADVTEPTAEMTERAHLEGLYRTFQDDNVVSRVFVNLKKALNAGGDFGFGDLVIKYPKTPANLLARGIEYSPFGFVQTVHTLAKPLTGGAFNQEQFARGTARAMVGSSLLVGVGFILARLGIITGRPEKDKDVRATQAAAGIRAYQINTSALKRFALSGMDPALAQRQEGDVLVSYDWAQPAAIGLALGANMALEPESNLVDKTINLADRAFAASETLAEQPLVRGLKTLTGRQSLTEGVSEVYQGLPASFTPTLLNQIRQLSDNTVRNTRDPNYFSEAAKLVGARIPGVSRTLPPQVTPLGEHREAYQDGSNNPFNVFLNPAFVNVYRPDPVSRMVLDLWQTSGETVHFPRLVSAKVKLGPEQVELSPEEYTAYQRYVGQKTQVLFDLLRQRPRFQALPPAAQAKKLQGYLTDINTAAKIEVLGYQPARVPRDVEGIMQHIGRTRAALPSAEAEDLGFTPE